jgi:hypothetical protein
MRIPLAVSVAVLALACACSSPPKDAAGGRIMVVDAHGAPIPGAFLTLLAETEEPASRRVTYGSAELKAQTSDAQGMIRAELDDCLWESDHSYHFRIRRRGYEDVTMSVSTELFPPVLRVEMRRLEPEAPPAPGAEHPQ